MTRSVVSARPDQSLAALLPLFDDPELREVAVVQARPLWNTPLLPLQFFVTAFAGAVGLVLLFFSASAGKRDMYILPALPALALAGWPRLSGHTTSSSSSPLGSSATRRISEAFMVRSTESEVGAPVRE